MCTVIARAPDSHVAGGHGHLERALNRSSGVVAPCSNAMDIAVATHEEVWLPWMGANRRKIVKAANSSTTIYSQCTHFSDLKFKRNVPRSAATPLQKRGERGLPGPLWLLPTSSRCDAALKLVASSSYPGTAISSTEPEQSITACGTPAHLLLNMHVKGCMQSTCN